MNGTVFVALPDLPENHEAMATLEESFSRVVVATARENAIREMISLGGEVIAAVVGVKEHVDASVLQALPGLRVLGSISVGTDHLDLDALTARGIEVVTTPGANAVSVAEHALAMILALAKRLVPAHAAVLSGADRAGLGRMPMEVRGLRVGVLGAGATARALIPLVQGLGATVTVWTRRPERHPDLPTTGLEDIFRSSDAVSIHLPLTAQTRGLVGENLLRLLPAGAMVVNTARKEIMDLAALARVLEQRPDLSVGIDAFGLAGDGVPDVADGRGVFSPHIAGITVQSLHAMEQAAVAGVVRAVSVDR
jgi:phosphoglycerate dehydrogenase-like enzyme